ncbi:MAG: hypothetical protein RL670_955, partial [Actinomycetota bacterium]
GDVAKGIADSFDHTLNQVIASFTMKQESTTPASESRASRFKKVMRGSGLESVIEFSTPVDHMAANQAAIDRIIEMQKTEEAIVIDTPQYVYVPGGRKRY